MTCYLFETPFLKIMRLQYPLQFITSLQPDEFFYGVHGRFTSVLLMQHTSVLDPEAYRGIGRLDGRTLRAIAVIEIA